MFQPHYSDTMNTIAMNCGLLTVSICFGIFVSILVFFLKATTVIFSYYALCVASLLQ